MINITIITVGKVKEKFYTEAVAEYAKRLKRYCKLNIIELKDEAIPENNSDKDKENILKREGERIAEKIPKTALVVALCVEGKAMSSEKLSDYIQQKASEGNSEIVFIIGGSLGISDEIKKRADLKLSFSEMTFPHQLMRVILTEQLYRAFNIADGGKYHK